MKLLLSVLTLLMLHCSIGTSLGSGAGSFGNYPLPLIEVEILLTKWLKQEKYSVSSNALSNGEIVLSATATGKVIRILMRSHSPLATDIELLEAAGIEDVAAVRSSWELSLSRVGKAESAATIPERIRSLADAVVCINSPPTDERKLNFTGFLIDKSGTIVTIAHDLEKFSNFKLTFSWGDVTEGHVLKRSRDKDLSVITSYQRGYSAFFPLKEGRSKLHFGERIYMLHCNSSGDIQIQAGEVDKPRAKVNSQALLQVTLENVFLGSSGSPVVDESGRFVGVVKGRFRGMETRGFLIPFDTVSPFVGTGR
ncbi:MAG TPA: trypsin-like peptidase domain-containing protein [Desulfuromonadales bacterium]|nr:trypsin-like peptidase domain-containing protein [Desulfuromonadales bacterium]